MTRESIGARLARLRDAAGDTHVLALLRIGLGLSLTYEAWLATEHFRVSGFFAETFYQPLLPSWLVPSRWLFVGILGAQWAAGLLVISGRLARPALLVAAALLVYTMLADRLFFHNYRHTMAAFATLLAFTSCDRNYVLGRAGSDELRPLWAANAMRLQVSIMYLASGGSKLLDPDWQDGTMMHVMVGRYARLVERRGVPDEWVHAVQSPFAATVLARGAIATELSLAVLLWWLPTRRGALWVGGGFHLTISLITPVILFTAEMLCVYVVFVTPDRHARVLRYGADSTGLARWVHRFDWFGRYRIESATGEGLAVIDRDGSELRGARLAACLFGTLPILFVAWPAVAVLSRLWPLAKPGSTVPTSAR